MSSDPIRATLRSLTDAHAEAIDVAARVAAAKQGFFDVEPGSILEIPPGVDFIPSYRWGVDVDEDWRRQPAPLFDAPLEHLVSPRAVALLAAAAALTLAWWIWR